MPATWGLVMRAADCPCGPVRGSLGTDDFESSGHPHPRKDVCPRQSWEPQVALQVGSRQELAVDWVGSQDCHSTEQSPPSLLTAHCRLSDLGTKS